MNLMNSNSNEEIDVINSSSRYYTNFSDICKIINLSNIQYNFISFDVKIWSF